MKTLMQALLLGTWLTTMTSKALADIAIIVHPELPLSTIDAQTATEIFMKKSSEVNGVALVPLDLHRDDPVRKEFYQRVANRTPDYMLTYWTRLIFTGRGSPPDYVTNAEEMLFAISRQKNAIGYVDAKQVNNKVKSILIIKQ